MPRLTFARMLEKFCQQRATTILSPRDAALFQDWLLGLLTARMSPPKAGRDYDWLAISDACGVDHADLKHAARVLSPGLDALTRDVRQNGGHHPRKAGRVSSRRAPRATEHLSPAKSADSNPRAETPAPLRRKPGVRAKPVVEFPQSNGKPWEDPAAFAEALDLHMRRHGDSSKHLARALASSASQVDETTLNMWRRRSAA